MPKENAPVIGGAGGGLFAWFQETFLLQVNTGFIGEMAKVAAFSLIGAAIGELVKFTVAWIKSKTKNKADE